MRKTIIVGNWKMNGSISDLKTFLKECKPAGSGVQAGLCVPYTLLATLKEEARTNDWMIGAQNMHEKESGAYTGEVSADMLLELGVDTVILGHSERRAYYNETDESVNRKLHRALQVGLTPIVCVGETLEERERGAEKEICKGQILKAFEAVKKEDAAKIIVAYEPVWAIGTGKTASSQDAEDMAGFIRSVLAGLFSAELAETVHIQYGGSVNPSNVEELMSMPNIDGALVGGASLKAKDFSYLIEKGGQKCQL